MASYPSAAARVLPEIPKPEVLARPESQPDKGPTSPPFARTIIYSEVRMPPPHTVPNTAKANEIAQHIIAYVAHTQLQNQVDLLRVEMDALRKEMEAVMAAHAHVTERSIEIATLTKSASLIVLVVCGLSFVVGLLSGFNALHPSVALLLGSAAVIFLVMGAMLAKESARNA